MPEFVHLHVHTQYSFLTSTVQLGQLAPRARALGMRAVAITDHALFGAIKHWQKCRAEGIQPILGAELNVARDARAGDVDHLVLLAASAEGYANLVALVSMAHTASVSEAAPAVRLDDVLGRARGLVVLTGCLGGLLAQAVLERGAAAADPLLERLKAECDPGALYVELQDHGFPEQTALNPLLCEAAARLGLPVVATNDVHFATRDDGEAQVYLECVRLGRAYADLRGGHHGSFEMYLKGADEMAAVFGARPDALRATLEIAERCSALELRLGEPMLPRFPVPEGFDTDGYFRHVAREGLQRRIAESRAQGRAIDETQYRERLEGELAVIASMKYAGYFLIVWDFIREARDRGIPVGPGRGSGAGSLVAWALGITSLDPVPYGLLFERFLNPERVSMPDFDVDFCMARRDEVIAYVASKYGRDSVGQIATFQNLKARSVIKDVARAMGIAAPEAQKIASLVPALGQGKMASIDQALEQEPKLKSLVESDPQMAELVGQARKLEGLTRHAGMHAAGVVISEGPLAAHVPCFSTDGATVTQYDKDDVEAAGLVKFDFLGLKTLTVIDVAERLVNARPDRHGRPLDLDRVPLDDKETYQLIASGDTTGVFQLESSGMQQQVLRPLKPDRFEDIIAAVALYRPGPMEMIPQFIESKHGRRPIRKLHPLVDQVLAPTYGVCVYQEQVMQIAQRMAGFTLGKADLLRRAMGKKKAEEMTKQAHAFVEGARGNGVAEGQAKAVFGELEKFASYGFNKSHAAAYAVLTYQTAYLKAHYPAEFFAALMTADKDKIEKVVRTIAEARAWGVAVLPPDINASATDFTVVYAHPSGDGPARGPGRVRDRLGPQLRFGLGAVRGLGEAALETMFEARREQGAFGDLFDFAARVDARRLNKAVLEALVMCGAFDSTLSAIGISRARAFAAIDRALERARTASRDRDSGQTSLFGLLEARAPTSAGNGSALADYPPTAEWDHMELLRREKQALGCYVSGHPLARYGTKLGRLGAVPAASVAGEKAWSQVSVAGMVEGYQERLFRGGTGGRAAFFEIEDTSGRVKAKLRQDRIETYAPLLTGGEPVLVTGKVSFPIGDEAEEELEPTLLVDVVVPLGAAALASTRAIAIRLRADRVGRAELGELEALLARSPGACSVELLIQLPDGAEACLACDQHKVEPSDALLGGLERVFGEAVAELR
jgi:DNA polymerase-3 subunit alpha